MKGLSYLFAVVVGLTPLFALGQISTKIGSCVPCEQLKDLQLPDVTIMEIETMSNEAIEADDYWAAIADRKTSFCLVRGKISKEIKFELLLPAQWNGRFLMSGNGGFAGSIQNELIPYINVGYAIVGTDTGHDENLDGASWALDNMERQLNFGSLAVHRTAVVSKSIINSYYGDYPSFSYFIGCSRGGGQAMMEAQVYPDDFDGYVAGAPAFRWPALGAKFVQISQNNYPNPNELSKTVITNDNLRLLQEHIFKQCDALDGLSDSILNDPRDCHIDFDMLPLCPNDTAGAECLTKEQLAAIKSVYSPLIVENQQVYPAFPFGLESGDAGWDLWISGTSQYLEGYPSLHYMFGTNLFKYLVYNDSSWDYSQYDFKNFFEETKYASAYLDATQTDYSELKKQNGKMIMYHGWNDPAISAYSTIEHYEEALKVDQDLHSYIRLFLLPGVLHCGGGTGPDQVDWVTLIQDWVENDHAPERVILSKVEEGNTMMTRPVYPYPKVTIYDGAGKSNDEKSFGVKGK
ncbi:tannase/feruloyl esterase family alpha/beta hydrolase [Algoriphagus antarcticus]|uniref:Feruloyl esterase n=1 Tax=Algoriphagus antarcticus TaxID=238540 RepID=A0A3E0DS07_9BACT|nr:tannase/feruloyl esterase family alpha/beta hydrolase [Algoriphagus antarcticus]REG86329.1 feruloyl esterase [Algoriphagus antarcticus]